MGSRDTAAVPLPPPPLFFPHLIMEEGKKRGGNDAWVPVYKELQMHVLKTHVLPSVFFV